MASLQAAPANAKPVAKPVRRLPVQKDWPLWAIVATQIGILIGIIGLWEIGARTGCDRRLLLVAAERDLREHL